MLNLNQTVYCPKNGSLYRVIEASDVAAECIIESTKTGGRMYLGRETSGAFYMRAVEDLGTPGTLLATLAPVGPRYRVTF